MGVIDKTTYELTCPNCKQTEKASVLDRGSGWGGSNWGGGAVFDYFETQWEGAGGSAEPKLLAAFCKQCKTEAQVSIY